MREMCWAGGRQTAEEDLYETDRRLYDYMMGMICGTDMHG